MSQNKELMRCKLLLAFTMMVSTLLAQNTIYTPGDGIMITYEEGSGVQFVHKVKQGHTLYSIARIFQTPVNRILSFNNRKPNTPLSIGQEIRIPFTSELMYTGPSISSFPTGTFIPVYYRVKKGETIYRIAKVYFNQSVEQILQRNKMSTPQLAMDQSLLIGWIPVDPTITLTQDSLEGQKQVVITQSTETDTLQTQEHEPIVFVRDTVRNAVPEVAGVKRTQTALAYWNKQGSDRSNLFVLHPTAKINSLIEIYNPQLQRRTYAKVLSRIPKGMYPNNIEIIVSPRVAEVLGALNSEFRVKLTYFE